MPGTQTLAVARVQSRTAIAQTLDVMHLPRCCHALLFARLAAPMLAKEPLAELLPVPVIPSLAAIPAVLPLAAIALQLPAMDARTYRSIGHVSPCIRASRHPNSSRNLLSVHDLPCHDGRIDRQECNSAHVMALVRRSCGIVSVNFFPYSQLGPCHRLCALTTRSTNNRKHVVLVKTRR